MRTYAFFATSSLVLVLLAAPTSWSTTTQIADQTGPRVLAVSLDGGPAPVDLLDGREVAHAGDRISLTFDEPVRVSAGDLVLTRGRGDGDTPTFDLSADGLDASWRWSNPLPSDSYRLVLADEVTDEAGNRLDGEWGSRSSAKSGNSLPGGDLDLDFSLVAGDADGSGRTDAADLAAVLDAPAAVGEETRGHLGDTASPLPPDPALMIATLGDSDADGTDEIATLQQSPAPRITVQQADHTAAERTIFLQPDHAWLDLEEVQGSADGVALGFAALSIDRTTGIYSVSLWDRAAGITRTWSLGRNELPRDLVAWVENGSTRLAVLGGDVRVDRERIRVLDVTTGRRSQVVIGSAVDTTDLAWAPAAGDRPAEVVTAVTSRTTGRASIQRIDGATLSRLPGTAIGAGEVAAMTVLPGTHSTPPRYALLRRGTTGDPVIEVRRQAGTRESRRTVAVDGEVREVVAWTDAGSDRLGLLDVDDESGATVFRGSDATGGRAFTTSFGSGRAGTSVAVVRAAGEVGLAVAGQNSTVGIQQVQVRWAEGNHRVRTLPLPGPGEVSDSWFLSNRVHGHVRYYPWSPNGDGYFGASGFDRAGADLASLGAPLFTRSARHFDEDPWWPSEVPLGPGGDQQYLGTREQHGITLAAGRSLLQEHVTEAWQHDEPMIAYYNDMSEAGLAAAHPEWVCRTATGGPAVHDPKGTYLDMTGPYGAIVQQRLLELADAGASGTYLDMRHLPTGGCYGSALAADFEAEYGSVPLPDRTSDYRAFLEYNARRLAETIDGWRRAVRQEYPSFRVITSVTSVPGLTRLEMDSELGAGGDTKTELRASLAPGLTNQVFTRNRTLARPTDATRIALGLVTLRDAQVDDGDGIVHVWHGLAATPAQERSFVAAVTTFGAVAALNVNETELAGGDIAGLPGRESYAEAFALGDRLSPALGPAPVSDTAVLFSERQRNGLFEAGDKEMWERLLLPLAGGFAAMTRSGMTPRVLNDETFLAGVPASVRTLWIPDLAGLGPGHRAALEEFRDRGGQVLNDETGLLPWATQAEYDASEGVLLEALTRRDTMLRVEGLPGRAAAAAFSSGSGTTTRLTVMVTNGFAHIQRVSPDEPVPPEGVAAQPADVPPGSRLVVDLARFGASSAADLAAFDGQTGRSLPVADEGPDSIGVTLPGFAEVAQVVLVRQ